MSVKGCDGRARTLEVRREPFSCSTLRPVVQWQKAEIQQDKRIGYLRISHFDEDTVWQIDAAMSDLNDTTDIIIDVRGNSGGTNSFVRLVSYFVPGQQLVSGLLTRAFFSHSKGESVDPTKLPKMSGIYSLSNLRRSMAEQGAIALYTEDMGSKVYRGNIVILSNGATASAAEGFIAFMKQKTKAIVIGTPTAGQLLTASTFALPNGWQLVVPVAVPVSPDGRLFKDTPISPNIEVKWTRQDVCQGHDPHIAKALEIFLRP